MERIGTVGRPGAARGAPAIPGRAIDAENRPEAGRPPARALVALDGGRRAEPRPVRDGAARPDAGFVTQLMLAGEPSLRPSRLERTRAAAARYAEAARRLA